MSGIQGTWQCDVSSKGFVQFCYYGPTGCNPHGLSQDDSTSYLQLSLANIPRLTFQVSMLHLQIQASHSQELLVGILMLLASLTDPLQLTTGLYIYSPFSWFFMKHMSRSFLRVHQYNLKSLQPPNVKNYSLDICTGPHEVNGFDKTCLQVPEKQPGQLLSSQPIHQRYYLHQSQWETDKILLRYMTSKISYF